MEENISQQQSEAVQTLTNNAPNSGWKSKIFLICAGFLLFILIGAGGFFLGKSLSQPKTPSLPSISQVSPTPMLTFSPTPTFMPEANPTLKTTTNPPSISIPKDWQVYTASDPDIGIKTTLSLPPGFSFSFSGSEFTIQNTEGNEIWDYSTSVFKGWLLNCDKKTIKFEDISRCCLNEARNYYSGGSRRAWYESFLNGDFSCIYPASDAKLGTIISVNEEAIDDNSYLKVTVETKSSEKETHYLYVQNNILHIIKPVSSKANSAAALLPKYINIVFYSLKSNQIK